MTSAATIRRSATLLGAILTALTLSGPAFGQTALGGVGSTVEATMASVQPVTGTVETVAAQTAAPVTGSQPKGTAAPVEDTVGATTSAATRPAQAAAATVVETVTRTTKAVTRTARAATSSVERTVDPVVRTAAKTVTQTLEERHAAVEKTLLGPLVERIDAQAEELLGPFGPSGTSADGGGTPVTGGSAAPAGLPANEPAAAGRTRADRPAAHERGPAPGSFGTLAGTSGGTSAGGPREPEPVSVPGRSRAPSEPFSAGGSTSGAGTAVAALAGLLALALAASLGRLVPWSDTIRPLAFVSPPERPG